MTTLWDTTGTAVVKALAAERRTGGAVLSGLALTLVVVVDEKDVHEAEAAATTAASRHPCRLLIVIRRQIEAPVPRLDAEVLVGGRLGPGEAVVMRMYGRLALHAESVTLPLLAPDAPVVTWWHGPPPDLIAHDPLGVFAERRITDVARCPDTLAALRQRAEDFRPGDTDIAWTRTTPWRAELASAFDTVRAAPVAAKVTGRPDDPATQLLAGWLSSRFGVPVPVEQAAGRAAGAGGIGVSEVVVELEGGGTVRLARKDSTTVVLERAEQPASELALPEREFGDLLAEELRRLDADQPYADALGVVTGIGGLADAPAEPRTHVWLDPMLQDGGGAAGTPGSAAAPPPAPATSADRDAHTGAHGESTGPSGADAPPPVAGPGGTEAAAPDAPSA
ncbi:MAG: glucose-6-phosphate dehydrogenase assembly protein OpcA [Mycobacteriales bacterium]